LLATNGSPAVRMIPLQSGSNGNCIYVEANGVSLLFDGGLSAAQTAARLACHGISLAAIDAMFISHEHSDHVSSAGAVARAGGFPLYITPRTFRVAQRRFDLSTKVDIRHFQAGQSVSVGAITVDSLPTPHDAVDGVVYVVDDGLHRLGICTDFGHVYSELRDLVSRVDGLYLESNYDAEKLLRGPYPAALKARISGPRGHISNDDAAALLADAATDRLQWVCLAHLSAKNNTAALALQTHRAVLGDDIALVVAKRYAATDPLCLVADMFQNELRRSTAEASLSAFWQQGASVGNTESLRRPIRQRQQDSGGGFRF